MHYEPGTICRTDCEVVGVGNDCEEVPIPTGSVVVILGSGELLENQPDSFRYTIRLLSRNGKRNKRLISYDGAWHDMLTPEPGVIQWGPRNSALAVAQGWNIFYCDGSEGPLWQLQRVDGSEAYQTLASAHVVGDRFKKDEDAWRFVWNRAVKADCELAKAALAFLYYRCPKEYETIRRLCLANPCAA